MTALRFDEVFFSYDDETRVLKGVSLAIVEGEQVALLGPNGVGKTTLTKLIVALLQPDRGEVMVGDRGTAGLMPEDLADRVAYVFQHPDQQLFARTVLDEVMFAPLEQNVDRDEARGVAVEALERVGLSSQRDAHPYDLPPAQRKLVTVAAAIAQQPGIMVLDEPTQGLDRAGVRRVGELLGGLAAQGVALLAVTHDVGFAAEVFGRAVVLSEGVVAFDGPSRELMLDEDRLRALGLTTPTAVRLSHALQLPGTPVREREVVAALADRRVGGRPVDE